MEMVHRFGAGKDEEYFESYFELLKEYPNAGNAVWFASHYVFPPVEKHEEEAARLNKISVILDGGKYNHEMDLYNHR